MRERWRYLARRAIRSLFIARPTTGAALLLFRGLSPSRDTATGPEHDYVQTIQALLDGFVKNGYAVVASDYAGLGISGFHPFLQGVPTGRNALDILRAARALEPNIGTRYAAMGHSQGGQVDLFTASQAQPICRSSGLSGMFLLHRARILRIASRLS